MNDKMENLEKARAAAHAARERGEVRTVEHNWLVKAKAKPTSLKLAINAKCFDCVGGNYDSLPDPGWKREIGLCVIHDCSLYPHRPYRKMAENLNAVDSDQSDDEDDDPHVG